MPEQELDYEKDTSIDMLALDLEFVQQPGLMRKYGKELAQAEKKVKRVHERLKTCRSELVHECKENNPKASAPIMEAYYRTNDEHKEAKQEWIDAEYDRDILQVAVNSIHQKRASLEGLVKLMGQQYFATPSVPLDINREWSKSVEDTRKVKRRTRARAK